MCKMCDDPSNALIQGMTGKEIESHVTRLATHLGRVVEQEPIVTFRLLALLEAAIIMALDARMEPEVFEHIVNNTVELQLLNRERARQRQETAPISVPAGDDLLETLQHVFDKENVVVIDETTPPDQRPKNVEELLLMMSRDKHGRKIPQA